MFIGRTTCNPSLALGPYEDWRGFINGTIPIPSYWAHTGYIQIDSSYNRWQRRICTLSVQLYSYVTSVCNSVFVSDKIINNSDNFRIKCLFYNKISVILCVLYFYAFLFNLWKYVILREKISFSFFIFDTCDVVYNWSSSLLPPIVLDNLFAHSDSNVSSFQEKNQFVPENWKLKLKTNDL